MMALSMMSTQPTFAGMDAAAAAIPIWSPFVTTFVVVVNFCGSRRRIQILLNLVWCRACAHKINECLIMNFAAPSKYYRHNH